MPVEIPKIGRRVFSVNARRLEPMDQSGVLIVMALEDMTSN